MVDWYVCFMQRDPGLLQCKPTPVSGNGWAAAGMLRVLATIIHSNFADQLQSERTDLKNWAVEILDRMYHHVVSLSDPPFHRECVDFSAADKHSDADDSDLFEELEWELEDGRVLCTNS